MVFDYFQRGKIREKRDYGMNVSDTEVLICFAYQEQVTFKLGQSPLVSDLSSDFSQTPFLFQSDKGMDHLQQWHCGKSIRLPLDV